jgi:hypothetical protein
MFCLKQNLHLNTDPTKRTYFWRAFFSIWKVAAFFVYLYFIAPSKMARLDWGMICSVREDVDLDNLRYKQSSF